MIYMKKAAKKYPRRFGDRPDGRKLRSLDPLYCVSPYIMKKRSSSSNLFSGTLDITEVEKYIRTKRAEGNPKLGMLHFFVASYVRIISQHPGLNRFISGQKIFSRFGILVNLSVKKELTIDGQETTIKAYLEPEDTINDVYEKLQKEIAEGKKIGDTNGTDKTARIIKFIPGLALKFVIWFLELLDYFGCLPKSLLHISPFHGSIFISDLGSIGIPPVFHHLYDFGNIPIFLCFGTKIRRMVTDREGKAQERVFMDFTLAMDERICDGYYFSRALRTFRHIFKDPAVLDLPPDNVINDVD